MLKKLLGGSISDTVLAAMKGSFAGEGEILR